MKQGLYFIAILPPDDIAKKVQGIKKEFVERYDSREAFKRPAHFTLQIPFKIPEQAEEVIIPQLIYFAEDQDPFTVTLSGFNHFRNEVIFIDVEDATAMKSLHHNLISFLQDEAGFTDDMIRHNSLTPHMTVAFRDLSPENFQKAWSEFKNRSFNYAFEVNSIYLLKHESKRWKPFFEFKFSST